MNLNLIQIITLFSGFLLFLLGFTFLFYLFGKKISNYLLAAFLLSNAVLLSNFFLVITFPLYNSHFQLISNIGFHSYLLLAPLLYLYIVSLCRSDFHISWKTLIHLIPFVFFIFLAVLVSSIARILEIDSSKAWNYYDLVYKPSLYIQIGAYATFSFKILKSYRLQLEELYSSLIKIDLMWVNLVLYFLIFMWFTDILLFTLGRLHNVKPGIIHYLLLQSISTNLLLCVSLIYKGMRQTAVPSVTVAFPKYGQTKADRSIYEENKEIITYFMKDQKPFLSPELSLDELAKKMNMPPKQLSQTINFCFNQNFNNFINSYRVDEAKHLFEIDQENRRTVYDLLFAAGFNSKSVFNESFKKFTGFTPKEYRKKLTKIES